MAPNTFPIALSNRHVHLSKEHLEALFGPGATLHKTKDLSQPGQYACEEQVTITGPKGSIERVRVLGPVRRQTQVEISLTDGFTLGLTPPVRDSGDLAGSPGIEIKGPHGTVILKEGVIAAARHVHMHTTDGEAFGLKDKDLISVRTGGKRSVVFENVLVRVHPEYKLEMHVDLDEGNAAGVKNGQIVEIIR